MKRKMIVLALIVALCSAVTMGSYAYFTASTTAVNVITTGSIDIELQEWADMEETVPFTAQTGVMPGAAVTKIVRVKNIGTGAAWIRVRVEKTIELSETANVPDDFEPNMDLIRLNMNTTDWKQQDGYWYYQNPLAAGEVTEPLFTEVSFDETMDDSYQRATAAVAVNAYAAQVVNNGTSAETADAAGWPAE